MQTDSILRTDPRTLRIKKYTNGLSIVDLAVIFFKSVFEERRTVLRDADQGIKSMAIGDLRPGCAVRCRMLLLRG
jgi:hypothetical protein